MKDEIKKNDPLEGIEYGVSAEDLAKRMGVPTEVIVEERIFMATVELGPCSSPAKDVCPCSYEDCRFHGRCCECIPHHLKFGKIPNCVGYMREGSNMEKYLPTKELTIETKQCEVERLASLKLGPCSNKHYKDCPCQKEDCRLHGRCCECMAHHRQFGMLPLCVKRVLQSLQPYEEHYIM